MLEQLQLRLQERLAQREQLIANVNAVNGAIEQLNELLESEKKKLKKPSEKVKK